MTKRKAIPEQGHTECPLIDRFLPRYDVAEYHETFIAAPGPLVYETARHIDLAQSPVTMVLIALRGLIALIQPKEARKLYGPLVRRPRLTLDDIVRAGFVVLEEEPGKEIVLGVVGKFWRPGSGIRHVAASGFVGWNEPGYGKGVWNFAGRREAHGSILSTETRVLCTDERARRSFHRYWRLIGPFSGLIRGRGLALIKKEAERAAGRSVAPAATGTIDPEG
jgi:hypothetical protein